MITLMRTDTPLSHLCFRCCGGVKMNKGRELPNTKNDYNDILIFTEMKYSLHVELSCGTTSTEMLNLVKTHEA